MALGGRSTMGLQDGFAQKIRERRIALNLTQEAVAQSLGISNSTVARWEQALAWPDAVHIEALANLFRISIQSLFDPGVDLTSDGSVDGLAALKIAEFEIKEYKRRIAELELLIKKSSPNLAQESWVLSNEIRAHQEYEVYSEIYDKSTLLSRTNQWLAENPEATVNLFSTVFGFLNDIRRNTILSTLKAGYKKTTKKEAPEFVEIDDDSAAENYFKLHFSELNTIYRQVVITQIKQMTLNEKKDRNAEVASELAKSKNAG